MDERKVNLERYYPNVLAPAKEFKVIAEAENPELNLLWQRLWKWYRNTFVYELDIQGAVRWESMLNIRPKVTDTLDERRAAILVKINTMLPYTHRRMVQILNVLCGEGKYDIDLNHVAGELYILTNPDITLNMNKIGGVLRPIIPANLAMCIVLRILQQWPIYHHAEIMQYVNATHYIWTDIATRYICLDSTWNLEGNNHLTGVIYQSENNRQKHYFQTLITISAYQKNVSFESILNSSFNLDSSRRLGGQVIMQRPINSIFAGGVTSSKQQVAVQIKTKSKNQTSVKQLQKISQGHSNKAIVKIRHEEQEKISCLDGGFLMSGSYDLANRSLYGAIKNSCIITQYGRMETV